MTNVLGLSISYFDQNFYCSNDMDTHLFLKKIKSFLTPILTFGNVYRINLLCDFSDYSILEDVYNFVRKKDDKLIINYIMCFRTIMNNLFLLHKLVDKGAFITIILKSNFNIKEFFDLISNLSFMTKRIELQV